MRGSRFSNTLSLTKVVLGTTLVSYPGMFKEFGILPMILSLVLIGGVLCSTSLYFLYMASSAIQAKTYEELGEKVYGGSTRQIIKTCVFLIGVFSLVIYIQLFSELLGGLIGKGEVSSKIYSGLICGALSSFSSSLSKLQIVNLVGLSSIFILVGTIFWQFLKRASSLKVEDLNFKSQAPGLFNKFGYISLCFCSHFVIIPFMNNLEKEEEKDHAKEEKSINQTTNSSSSLPPPYEINFNGAYKNYRSFTEEFQKKKANLSIIFFSSFLSVLIYIFVGVVGYMAFPDTKPNWANNPLGTLLSTTLSFLLISVIVLSYPLCVVASKDILVESFSLPQGMNIPLIWLLTAGSCFTCLSIKDYSLMYNLFLTFGSLVMFIYPPLFYFKLIKPLSKAKGLLGGVTLMAGFWMMTMSIKEMLKN